MRLLLDTHAFIWWDEDRLPAPVTRLIKEADDVYVSAVTAWEIAIKSALGKIAVRGTVAAAVDDYGFSPLPVTIEHADAIRSLPAHHKDPFDRCARRLRNPGALGLTPGGAKLQGGDQAIVGCRTAAVPRSAVSPWPSASVDE